MARMAMLHRFLTRVVNHPVLSYNSSLHTFLTAHPSVSSCYITYFPAVQYRHLINLNFQEFQIHRKAGGQGILGRVSDSIQSITTAYVGRQPAPEFDAVKDYINILGEKLSQIDKVSQRLNKERMGKFLDVYSNFCRFLCLKKFSLSEYQAELHQLHPVLTLWSTSEPELGPLMLNMAAAVERNAQAQQTGLLETFNGSIAQVNDFVVLIYQEIEHRLRNYYKTCLFSRLKRRAIFF